MCKGNQNTSYNGKGSDRLIQATGGMPDADQGQDPSFSG